VVNSDESSPYSSGTEDDFSRKASKSSSQHGKLSHSGSLTKKTPLKSISDTYAPYMEQATPEEFARWVYNEVFEKMLVLVGL